jgi:hypothetical protein
VSNSATQQKWGYGGVEVGLLSVLEFFQIEVKCCLEVSTGLLIPKKERLINKHRVLNRSNSI